VQHITLKGVASGLQARGIGDLSYSFVNNAGQTQILLLCNCLYVPDCAVRLICPREIGAVTGNSADGLYATHPGTLLVVDGQPTTVKYDNLTPLPILFTKPGITTYLQFANNSRHIIALRTLDPTPKTWWSIRNRSYIYTSSVLMRDLRTWTAGQKRAISWSWP